MIIKQIILFLLFSTLIYAKNPIAFAALGDVIYNNVDKIKKLKDIDVYKGYQAEIDDYLQKVKKTKEEGFLITPESSGIVKRAYLNKLRTLSKNNDFFIATVEHFYDIAKKEQNSKLFSQLINSGLLNTNAHKHEIIEYYFAHAKEMNTTGIIQSYLDEDKKLRIRKERQRRLYRSKKERQAARIREIREEDRLQRERLEKRLQRELQKKKEEIREYKERELKKIL